MELCVILCHLFIVILQLLFYDVSVAECGRQYDNKQRSRFRRDSGYNNVSLSTNETVSSVADISKEATTKGSSYNVTTTTLGITQTDLTAASVRNKSVHKTLEIRTTVAAQNIDIHINTAESSEVPKTSTDKTIGTQSPHASSIPNDDKTSTPSDANKVLKVGNPSTKQLVSNTPVKTTKPHVKYTNSEISEITKYKNTISTDLNTVDESKTTLQESKANANMQTKPTTKVTKPVVVNPIDSISDKEINSNTVETSKLDSSSDFTTKFYKATTKEKQIILKSENDPLYDMKQMESITSAFTNIPTGNLHKSSHEGVKQTALSGGPEKSNSLDNRSSLPAPALPPTGKTSPSLTLIATNSAISSESSSLIDTSSVVDTTASNYAVESVTSATIEETTADKTSKIYLSTTQREAASDEKTSTVKAGMSTKLTNALRTTSIAKSTTVSSDKRNGNISERTDAKDQEKSMFGKYGLPMFIAASALALCLLIVVIYLLLKKKEERKQGDFMVRDSTPKLKMLEVRNDSLTSELKAGKKSNNDDDLPTYSLDYEKHVQEKIEEHRKLAKIKNQNPALPGAEPTPLAGVSSFKIARRPSAESGGKGSSRRSRSGSQSGPTSPVTPTSAEGKPLLNKEDEPIVFNFAKKPGEATAARAAREARRGSTPVSGNKPKSVTKSKDDYFGINV